MSSRIRDLQQAQVELVNLARSGWSFQDLQHGRALVHDVLWWLDKEKIPVSRTCQAAMIANEHSDSPKIIKRAAAAAEQAIALGLPSPGGDNPIFATSFCNMGHYLKSGRPVDHECYILPPTMLAAERVGDLDEANRILSSGSFKRRGTVRGKRAPLVAGEGNVYDKPQKYHKAHGLFTSKLQDATATHPEIFNVFFEGGDAAIPYGVVEKFRNKPLYHVYLYDPGHAANFTYARSLDHVYSKDDAFKALRRARSQELS